MSNEVASTTITYIIYYFNKQHLRWDRYGTYSWDSPEAAADSATKDYLLNKTAADLFCVVKETKILETLESFSLQVERKPIGVLPTVPKEKNEPPLQDYQRMLSQIQQYTKTQFHHFDPNRTRNV